MSEFLAHFHFIRPLWLIALVPSAALIFYLLKRYQRRSQWQHVIDSKLLPFLVEGTFSKTQKIPLYGLALIWLLLIVALAGPAWEKKPQPVQQDTSALVILWDLSPSMYAQDIKPSRLVRSRLKLVDLLDAREEGLTALIAYAADAHVVTPLTDDTKTIKSLLPGLAPNVMPEAGSNPEQALELAINLLKETGVAKGNIVFVTDGIVNDAVRRLGAISSKGNNTITVWGIGTQQGAPIPLPDGGFAKNKRGEIVVARVKHDVLSDAAVAMSGSYIPFAFDSSDIDSILHFGFGNFEKKAEGDARQMDRWFDRGYWLVLLALPFAALAFRRGWLLCFALAGVFFQPAQSYALDWQDLWKNKDQQAHELLNNEEAEKAAETFSDPQWQAIANYKAGNYEAAESFFSQDNDAQTQYNLGNALTQQGKYDTAIAAYTAALGAQPNFPEAEHNRKIAEKLKELSEQQQQNSDQQDQGGQQDGDAQEQSQQGEQSQSDQESKSSQSENSESSDNQSQQNQSQENQSQQSASDDQQNTDKESDDKKSASKEEQEAKEKALEEHYKNDENQNSKEQDGEETQNKTVQKQQEDADSEGDNDDKKQSKTVSMQMTPEQKEQQQALDQWLRRVPDDPSGLLRNKFQYEYNKRRRENFDRTLQNPDGGEQEERW